MRASCAPYSRVRKLLTSVSAAALLAAQMGSASAHTVSIGYAFAGPGSVNIWYGSYHADATYTEADLLLRSNNGFYSIVPFTMIMSTKPTGLVDGVTNFYSNSAGTALVGTPQIVSSTDGSGGSYNPATRTILNWQGVTFNNLRPGVYTFPYNPLSMPTVEWHPINEIIRTNTFTLTAQDVLGIDSFASYATNTNQRAVARARYVDRRGRLQPAPLQHRGAAAGADGEFLQPVVRRSARSGLARGVPAERCLPLDHDGSARRRHARRRLRCVA